MFIIPYKWFYSHRTFYQNLSHCWHDWWHGLYNIIRWTPIIWHDEDWDYGFLLHVMEYKFRRMGKCFRDHGHLMSSTSSSKECFECAELCKRIRGDDYHMEWSKFHGNQRGKVWADMWEAQSHTDQKRLVELIGRKLRHWWD